MEQYGNHTEPARNNFETIFSHVSILIWFSISSIDHRMGQDEICI
ncbi:14190_t:CDS:2 [Entrophospora sp. SA101]|nr:14190_t:CDS:2 [Entrophospora sp. SA101]